MDDALLVSGGQALCDLYRVVERCARGNGPVAQSLTQRLALEQFRHDVGHAVVHADVVHREDVRVIQRRSGSRFLLEALKPAGIGRGIRGKHLDRDVAPESRVATAIDLAHSARAEQGKDFVGTEMDTGCQRHDVTSPRRALAG